VKSPPGLISGRFFAIVKLMSFELTQDYKTYIKSPQWKAKCARYWALNGKKCQACGSRNKLHVHHNTYDRFKRELMSDLTGVCDSCHRRIHQQHRANRKVSLKLVTHNFVKAMRNKKL
jgi:phage terminase large subunit GpA-like protein